VSVGYARLPISREFTASAPGVCPGVCPRRLPRPPELGAELVQAPERPVRVPSHERSGAPGTELPSGARGAQCCPVPNGSDTPSALRDPRGAVRRDRPLRPGGAERPLAVANGLS